MESVEVTRNIKLTRLKIFVYLHFRPYGNDSSAVLTTDFSFTKVTVQGGGTLEIDSAGNSMKLIGTELLIESGGVLIADFVDIEVMTLTVDESAKIQANVKV